MSAGRWILALAGVSGCAAVGLGAYGAHGLTGDEVMRRAWETGVAYQFWHTLALVAVAMLMERRQGMTSRLLGLAALLFAFGIFGFSGSLYVFGKTGEVLITGLAPIGGMSLMAGWLAFAVAAFRRP